MKVRRVQAPWLVVLGQNALMLYFVHQVVALTFLRQRFGVLFHSWWPYVLANALLIAALVVLAQVWPGFKRRAFALVRASTQRGASAVGGGGEARERATAQPGDAEVGGEADTSHLTRGRARPGATAPPGRAWARCPTRARRPPCPPPRRPGG